MPPKKAVFRAYISVFRPPGGHKFKWLLCIERGFLEDSIIKKFHDIQASCLSRTASDIRKTSFKKYSDQINKRTGRNKGVLVGKILKINKRTGYVYSGPQSRHLFLSGMTDFLNLHMDKFSTTMPRGNCNPHFENSCSKTGRFEKPRFPCSELHRLD